jgi:DNA-binding Lrp family transcriptional regulator
MLSACILIKAVPTKMDAILKVLKEIPNVEKAYFTYGRFDIVAFFEAGDYKAVREVTSKVNSLEGVRSTETLVEA